MQMQTRTVLAVVSLALLCAQAAARAAPAQLAAAATECVCASDDPDRPQQLIRGSDQVASCERGDYCDCETKTVQQCYVVPIFNEQTQFNEESQICDVGFDCGDYLGRTTPAPSTASPPEACACRDDIALPLQLIRGANQVAQCKAGKYCDCAAKTVKKCDSYLASVFSEEEQECEFDLYVDCQEYLEGTTPEPEPASPQTAGPTQPAPAEPTTPAAPTTPAQPCTCKDDKYPQQLIRGSSQVAQCDRGDYCDCETKTVQHCDALPGFNVVMHFNEEEQMCDVDVDCQEYLSQTTPAPQASTPTPQPQGCVCQEDVAKLPLQLIRGANQLAQCKAGKYCDCAAKTVRKCEGIMAAVFSEEEQECVFDLDVDCEQVFGGSSAAPSSPTSGPSPTSPTSQTARTPSSRTSTPASARPFPTSSGSQRTLSSLLYAVTTVLVVVNLLLVSRRCCGPAKDLRLRSESRAQAAHQAYTVPVVYSSDLLSTKKVPLESAA